MKTYPATLPAREALTGKAEDHTFPQGIRLFIVWQAIFPVRRQEGAMDNDALVQRAYTAVLGYFIQEGRAPHYTELGQILGQKPEEAKRIQHKAAESALACWFVKDTDYIESWAPFSNVPTHYLITIAGTRKWYGQ